MMKPSKRFITLLICAVTAILLFPTIVLYIMEDINVNSLHEQVIKLLEERQNTSKHLLISAVYAKYSDSHYAITTTDELQYPLPYYQAEDSVIVNDTLLQLKQLEHIGMIKTAYFTDIATNQQMISRINEYQGDAVNYSKIRIFLSADQFQTAFTAYERENITDKIISLKIPKQYIDMNKTVLMNYIRYLDIEADDWVINDTLAVSKTRRIHIKTEVIHDLFSIAVLPHPYD